MITFKENTGAVFPYDRVQFMEVVNGMAFRFNWKVDMRRKR